MKCKGCKKQETTPCHAFFRLFQVFDARHSYLVAACTPEQALRIFKRHSNYLEYTVKEIRMPKSPGIVKGKTVLVDNDWSKGLGDLCAAK